MNDYMSSLCEYVWLCVNQKSSLSLKSEVFFSADILIATQYSSFRAVLSLSLCEREKIFEVYVIIAILKKR